MITGGKREPFYYLGKNTDTGGTILLKVNIEILLKATSFYISSKFLKKTNTQALQEIAE